MLKRLGAAAGLPDELRHAHALCHTCATELLRVGATVTDVCMFLSHASVSPHRFTWPPERIAKSTSSRSASAVARRSTATADAA